MKKRSMKTLYWLGGLFFIFCTSNGFTAQKNDNLFGEALKKAISDNNLSQVEILLEKGANPNEFYKLDLKKDLYDKSEYRIPIFLAIKKNNYKVVKALLDNGANPNVYRHGKPPLYYCASIKRIKIFELLLKNGADPDIMLNGASLVFRLISILDEKPYMEKALDILLENGVNTNIGNNNMTPLEYAIISEKSKLIKKLLQYGADPNLVNEKGATPTLYALKLYGEDSNITKDLLNGGGIIPPKDQEPRYWFQRKDPSKYVPLSERDKEEEKPKEKIIYH